MQKKKMIYLGVGVAIIAIFGSLFSLNSDLFKGSMFSTPMSTSDVSSSPACKRLAIKVNMLTARNEPVTDNLSALEKRLLIRCGIKIKTNDRVIKRCEKMQKRIEEILASGQRVTDNLSETEQKVVSTCNKNPQTKVTFYAYDPSLLSPEEARCALIGAMVQRLEASGQDVTATLSTEQMEAVYSCGISLAALATNEACDNLQNRVDSIILSGQSVSDNLSSSDYELVSSCNANGGSHPNFVTFYGYNLNDPASLDSEVLFCTLIAEKASYFNSIGRGVTGNLTAEQYEAIPACRSLGYVIETT